MHASGRNSGVIHAGIYYSTNSLKAKFWKEGNRRLIQYCTDNNLDLLKCGKFIVASNEDELSHLYEIYHQGIKNGINISLMSRKEAMMREPLLRGYGEDVIFSPNTSVANPVQVITWLSNELNTKHRDYWTQFYNQNSLVFMNTKNSDTNIVITADSRFEGKYLINCGGQQAHSIAEQFGFGQKYMPLPVKGNYLISNRKMNDVIYFSDDIFICFGSFTFRDINFSYVYWKFYKQ